MRHGLEALSLSNGGITVFKGGHSADLIQHLPISRSPSLLSPTVW